MPTTLLLFLLALGCQPTPAAAPEEPVCAEAALDACRETCETCAGSTPGNSCNVCAEACAAERCAG